MGHFAEIGEDGVVIRVIVCDDGPQGASFLTLVGGTWVQTSYNTYAGQHRLGGTPSRKNYAGIGYTYDPARDAFIPPKPYPSWILDEDTCCYTAPVARPAEGGPYHWNEETVAWKI